MPDNNKVNIFTFYYPYVQRFRNTIKEKSYLQICLTLVLSISAILKVNSQACLPNFDFEKGDFTNWECSSGFIGQDGVLNLSASGPALNRHTILKATADGKYDQYGDFFVNSPNGSNYCVKLGNNNVGAEAEQISYTFKVPADKNDYSIIFNYAVVFENPDHQIFEQPRFTSKVFDVTDNKYIPCGSFDFAASSGLPGFIQAGVSQRDGSEIYYKPWSSVTIKLVGYENHEVRLEFTTNDCSKRGHFGYAYIDVVNNCNTSLITGNVACALTGSLSLTAPSGFAGYNWYNADFSTLLASSSKLTIKPIPPVGTKIALEIIPYPGLGCVDTVYTTIKISPDTMHFGVYDSLQSCLPNGISLSSALLPTNNKDIKYEFFLDKQLENAVTSFFKITQTGQYYVRAENSAGCVDVKPVKLNIYPFPVFAVTNPQAVRAPETVNLNLAVNDPTNTYTFWKDENVSISLLNPAKLNIGGKYYIKGVNTFGCSSIKPVTVIIKSRVTMPNAFSPNTDGKNDLYKFTALGGIRDLQYFRIYNRLGQLVYSTTTYGQGWDGKVGGKLQDAGVYVWMATATDWDGTIFTEQGSFVLVR
jgi:gliding motility-associated-like protein